MASHRQQIIFKVYFYLPERNIKYFDKTELLCCLFKILLTITGGQPWPGPAPAVSDWFKTYFLPLNSSTLDTASHNIFSAYFTRKTLSAKTSQICVWLETNVELVCSVCTASDPCSFPLPYLDWISSSKVVDRFASDWFNSIYCKIGDIMDSVSETLMASLLT